MFGSFPKNNGCSSGPTIACLWGMLLFSFLFLKGGKAAAQNLYEYGGIVRGDTTQTALSLVFTGHEYAEGGEFIRQALKYQGIKASFFFTGDFYRNSDFDQLIRNLKREGHYLGAHSDRHLLYASWEDRDSLLVTKETFINDLKANYEAMEPFGIRVEEAPYYLPAYEWYNDSIAQWTEALGLQLINYSKGTLSHADYTTEDLPAFRSSESIFESILAKQQSGNNGLNGFILLMHIGAGPDREDKFFVRLPSLLSHLQEWGYSVVGLEELLKEYP